MSKLAYFNIGGIDRKYSLTDEGLTKRALILVEGQHTDSKKRVHTFDKDFINEVADNTNTLFEQGSPVPILLDHVKSVDSTVGGLESPVYVQVITEENLPNKKARHLIGKLGIFVDQAVIKADKAIEKVSKNIVQTISAGVDLVTKSIREVSLTSTPSIVGMTLFKSHYSNFESSALSFDDLENDDDQMNQLEEEYEKLTEKLWEVTKNIQFADEETLNGANPEELQMQAIEDFAQRLLQLIGLGQDEQDEQQYQDPRLQQNQGQNPNFKPQTQGQFSINDAPIAAFSMADMEALNIVEFGRGADKRKRKSRLGRNLAMGAAGLAGAGLVGAGIYAATRGKKVGGLVNKAAAKTEGVGRTLVTAPSVAKKSLRQLADEGLQKANSQRNPRNSQLALATEQLGVAKTLGDKTDNAYKALAPYGRGGNKGAGRIRQGTKIRISNQSSGARNLRTANQFDTAINSRSKLPSIKKYDVADPWLETPKRGRKKK